MATEATEVTGGGPAEARRRSPAIECRGVTRRYAGVVANDQIDLEVAEGEIHALVGENGAGKSTLMKMLYGLEQPDEGQILVRGCLLYTSPSPRDSTSSRMPSSA